MIWQYITKLSRTLRFLYKSAHSDVVFIISLVGMAVIVTNILRSNFDFHLISILYGILQEYTKIRDALFHDLLGFSLSDTQKDICVIVFLLVSSFIRSWLILTKELRDAGEETVTTCLFDMLWPFAFLFHILILVILTPLSKAIDFLEARSSLPSRFGSLLLKLIVILFEALSHAPVFLMMVLFAPLIIVFGKPNPPKDRVDGDKFESPLARELWNMREGMRRGSMPITGPAFHAMSVTTQHWPLVFVFQFTILILAILASDLVFLGSHVAAVYGVQ